jgi:16S rRNA (uracil1498-N3)-methyltransferase
MEYFYAPPEKITSQRVRIEGDEFTHLTRVMRKRVGDELTVVDGNGMAYEARIAEITRAAAVCSIAAIFPHLHESERQLTLAVALLHHGANFDFLIEKCTELGVSRITPLLCERTVRCQAKVERWRKVAVAAMKQSGRCLLPAIESPQRFRTFVESLPPTTLRILLHQAAETPLREIADTQGTHSVCACIGPEGGFSDEEVAFAVQAGFRVALLGPRRLRSETAAIAAAALLIG